MPDVSQVWPLRSHRPSPSLTTWGPVSPLYSRFHSSSSFTHPTSRPFPSIFRVTWPPARSWRPWRSCHVTVRPQQNNINSASPRRQRFIHVSLMTVYNKSESPQYHSSSLLSQAMVITDSSSLGTLTSLAAVRQVRRLLWTLRSLERT